VHPSERGSRPSSSLSSEISFSGPIGETTLSPLPFLLWSRTTENIRSSVHLCLRLLCFHRMEVLGVGSCIRNLSKEHLTAALKTATGDVKQIEKARILGEEIRAEKGVANAIESIYRDLVSVLFESVFLSIGSFLLWVTLKADRIDADAFSHHTRRTTLDPSSKTLTQPPLPHLPAPHPPLLPSVEPPPFHHPIQPCSTTTRRSSPPPLLPTGPNL
jgi:hypothetical protein